MAAVGTVTVTKTRLNAHFEQVSIAWTCDASGNVSGNAFAVGVAALWQAKFIPGSGGTQPTNLYDVTVNDANGCDMAAGKGANLSNATASIGVQSGPLSIVSGTLDLVVANAGNAKQGTVVLLVGPIT
jgi:hypothetical protein